MKTESSLSRGVSTNLFSATAAALRLPPLLCLPVLAALLADGHVVAEGEPMPWRLDDSMRFVARDMSVPPLSAIEGVFLSLNVGAPRSSVEELLGQEWTGRSFGTNVWGEFTGHNSDSVVGETGYDSSSDDPRILEIVGYRPKARWGDGLGIRIGFSPGTGRLACKDIAFKNRGLGYGERPSVQWAHSCASAIRWAFKELKQPDADHLNKEFARSIVTFYGLVDCHGAFSKAQCDRNLKILEKWASDKQEGGYVSAMRSVLVELTESLMDPGNDETGGKRGALFRVLRDPHLMLLEHQGVSARVTSLAKVRLRIELDE